MSDVPPGLERIVSLFAASPRQVKLQALLDYSERLPALPDHIDSSQMERVHECQSAFFVAVEVDDDTTVHLFFDAPREAPTTRGYAGIIAAGLDGLPADQVLAIPDDFYTRMGLADVVTPMRLRGMQAILGTVKRQVRDALAA